VQDILPVAKKKVYHGSIEARKLDLYFSVSLCFCSNFKIPEGNKGFACGKKVYHGLQRLTRIISPTAKIYPSRCRRKDFFNLRNLLLCGNIIFPKEIKEYFCNQ
jgi:hypothetical protein